MAGGAYSSISDVVGSSIADASATAGIDAATAAGLTSSLGFDASNLAAAAAAGVDVTGGFTPTAAETANAFANPTTFGGISGATPATAADLASGDFSQISGTADLLAGGGAAGAGALGGVSPAAQALSATGNPLTPSFSAPAVSSPPPAVTGSAGGAGAGTSGVGGAAATAAPPGVATDPANVGGFNQTPTPNVPDFNQEFGPAWSPAAGTSDTGGPGLDPALKGANPVNVPDFNQEFSPYGPSVADKILGTPFNGGVPTDQLNAAVLRSPNAPNFTDSSEFTLHNTGEYGPLAPALPAGQLSADLSGAPPSPGWQNYLSAPGTPQAQSGDISGSGATAAATIPQQGAAGFSVPKEAVTGTPGAVQDPGLLSDYLTSVGGQPPPLEITPPTPGYLTSPMGPPGSDLPDRFTAPGYTATPSGPNRDNAYPGPNDNIGGTPISSAAPALGEQYAGPGVPDVSGLGGAGQLLGDTAGNISGAAAGPLPLDAGSGGGVGAPGDVLPSGSTDVVGSSFQPSTQYGPGQGGIPSGFNYSDLSGQPVAATEAPYASLSGAAPSPLTPASPWYAPPSGGVTTVAEQFPTAVSAQPTDITPYTPPPGPGSIADQWGDPLGNLQRNLGLGTPDTITATPSLGAEAAPGGTVTVHDLVSGEGNVPPDRSVSSGGPWATPAASPDLTASPTGGFASPAAQDLTGTLAPDPAAAALSPSDQIDLRGLDMVTPDTWNAATAEQGFSGAATATDATASPVVPSGVGSRFTSDFAPSLQGTAGNVLAPSDMSTRIASDFSAYPAAPSANPMAPAVPAPATPASPIAPTEVVRSESFPVTGASPTADLTGVSAGGQSVPLNSTADVGGYEGFTSEPGSPVLDATQPPGSVPATGGAGGSAAAGAGAGPDITSPAVAGAAANPPRSGGGASVSSDGFTPTVAGSSTLDASLAAGGAGAGAGGGGANYGGAGGKPWWQSMVAPAGALAGGAAALALSPSSPLSGIFGSSAYPGETQIAQEAQAAQTNSQQLEGYLSSGTLPSGLQASLTAAKADAETAIKSKYASMGMSGSSAEQQDIQNLNTRIVAQQGSMALQLFQQGVSEADLSSRLYTEIMNQAIAQDQALSQSISGIAGALASLAVPLVAAA